MRLTQRLLLGSFIVVGLLVAVVVYTIDQRLARRIQEQTVDELAREARLVAQVWSSSSNADSLADASGRALGHRVTLIRSDGHVIGDSEFDGIALATLQNHSNRPEVQSAMARGEGSSRRLSPSAGDEEVYVAVRTRDGIARVSVAVRAVDEVLARARRDVLVAGSIAIIAALFLAALFARAVSRPIVELRDVATAIAGGDLSRRPSVRAPAEVGELERAVHSLGEQLDARVSALQTEEAFSRGVFDALNEGVLAVSGDGHVVRINSAARRMLRIEDATPFPASRLPDEPDFREAVDAARDGQTPDALEVPLGGRTLALTAAPLGNGGAVLVLFDVTRMRRLERVRRDFVGNVSHELKTPLTVIRGFAETLLDDQLPTEHRQQFASAIRSNSSRMQRLVDDLLDLSRIESGGWVPEPEDQQVELILREVAALVRRNAEPKGLTVNIEVDQAGETVHADPTAARQVMTNLAENAVRYTHEGSLTLFSHRDNGGVWLGVRDTGIGIPAEHLPRIFERFYRVDAARSRSLGGTGLGLSIVKHLAQAHGGRVRAASEPGSGSTVEAYFPD